MDNLNSSITELLSLIEKKSQLFNSIMEITLEQKKDIEENGAVDIEKLVKVKQTLIEKVDIIDKAFSEEFNMLKKQLRVNSLEEVDVIKYPTLKILRLKVAEIMATAKKIMNIEESNKEKLNAIMSVLRKEMKQINVGKKSIKAYESPMLSNDGLYIDKKK